jgi:hypothetical protein
LIVVGCWLIVVGWLLVVNHIIQFNFHL